MHTRGFPDYRLIGIVVTIECRKAYMVQAALASDFSSRCCPKIRRTQLCAYHCQVAVRGRCICVRQICICMSVTCEGIDYSKFDIPKNRSHTIALQRYSPGNPFLYRVTLAVDRLAYLASLLRCVSHHLKHISQTYEEKVIR